MDVFFLKIVLAGRSDPLLYEIEEDTRNRILQSKQCDNPVPQRGFWEFETLDKRHVLCNNQHICLMRILEEMPESLPSYTIVSKRDPGWKLDDDVEQVWEFTFYVEGLEQPLRISTISGEEHVRISCSLLGYDHDGDFYLDLMDEDSEPVLIPAHRIMLAEGFDWLNTEKITQQESRAHPLDAESTD